ncbi:hypothetical protein [Mycobacterium spongiae]|uniref:RiboL-PSP-HEPN domain-containing protein n=1 Tax=Mycobacterium spongiae TaxID=886343 RepID=A0A975K0R5_9MYCO|nr:hypothetical protein [Mycobacterium spongiae]QUR69242.1 hypothetical protein F6B93_21140 [Mycobacterium spongiae]
MIPADEQTPHVDADLARDIAEAVFVAEVESGNIPIGDRQVEGILADFRARVCEIAAPPEGDSPDQFEFLFAIDHRDSLLEKARLHATAGLHEIALILYATWIEHSINAIISRGLERKGISSKSTLTLLKEVRNQKAKITALWEVAGIPAMDAELAASIQRIADLRNAFVHYKWHGESGDTDAQSSKDRYTAATEECAATSAALAATEESFYWDGRRDEVLTAFHSQRPGSRKETTGY